MKLSKNKLKYYSSLKIKKFRESEEKFICEGDKSLSEAFGSEFEIEAVFVAPEKMTALDLSKIRADIYEVSSKEMNKICNTKTPQGIAFVLKKRPLEITLGAPIIAALYDVSDPGNLGTIIRNCDWFGINELLISKNSADIYNPKVLRAAMGSFFHLKIEQTDKFVRKLEELKEAKYSVICADLRGMSIYKYKPKDKIVVLLSNEAHGPSNKILQIADTVITVPKFGRAESLNVANASAVIFSELTKKLNS